MHHRTTSAPGQGVDGDLLSLVINAPALRAPHSSLRKPQTHGFLGRTWCITPAKSRNPAGDLRPRHESAERLRQPAGGARVDRALSDGGGPSRPSWRVSVWS